jgi:prepilin-type N-terminal cleavage/methylation domain-containing protein
MKIKQNKTGVTLVEILVVVAIIAILTAITIGVASRINTQGKEQLTKDTIALLTAALGQFRDYGYTYSDPNLKFPLDCNNFPDTDLAAALGGTISGGTNDPCYSGCEAMYFFLNQVPECRLTLAKIDKKLVTNIGLDGGSMIITITADGQIYPLYRVVDPWGTTLRYSYYNNGEEGPTSEPQPDSPRTFPVITSAGPDKIFGTADDIASR